MSSGTSRGSNSRRACVVVYAGSMSIPGLTDDLERVVSLAGDDMLIFRNARIYLTGGTGFVGTWLLASIAHANARLGARISVDVLTRNASAFVAREPELTSAAGISVRMGDVRRPPDIDARYDAVIGAATPTSSEIHRDGVRVAFDSMLEGHRATLAIADRSGRVPFLFTSSGAVYGPQPDDLARIDERFVGGPNQLDPESAYAEGKRACELLSSIATVSGGPQVRIARMFAFVGPYLPIDQHFAIGNFIRDALGGGPIIVRGDGRAVRSYLYATDMVVWLWAILARGTARTAYNVGSENAVEIRTLANMVALKAGRPLDVVVESAAASEARRRYVPSTQLARGELALRETVDLSDAIDRAFTWHKRSVHLG